MEVPSMTATSSGSLSSDDSNLKSSSGESPYLKAKHVQLAENDPFRAISLFWSAINSRDQVDIALKDMVAVMKQVNRDEEAIQAIKSFRGLCSIEAQDALDNTLLDLCKKCGNITEQIEVLRRKLRKIDLEIASCGSKAKTVMASGKRSYVTIEHQKSRLLGNLGWAYMQYENYKEAEQYYRQALEIDKDFNNMCNLAICLMQTGRIAEAKTLLNVKIPTGDRNGEPYLKSFEKAWEIMDKLELGTVHKGDKTKEQSHVAAKFAPAAVSFSDEKRSFTPSSSMRKKRDVSSSNGNTEVPSKGSTPSTGGKSSSSEGFRSPVSVKVTSVSKPVRLAGYSVERTTADENTEKIVIRLDIQMPKELELESPSVISSKKVEELAKSDQIVNSIRASMDNNPTMDLQKEATFHGAAISFGSLGLGGRMEQSSGPRTKSLPTCSTIIKGAENSSEGAKISFGTLDLRCKTQECIGLKGESFPVNTAKRTVAGTVEAENSANGFKRGTDIQEENISFGSLDLIGQVHKRSGPEIEPLSTNCTRKSWADMVEEDEQFASDNSVGDSMDESPTNVVSVLKSSGKSWADIADEEESSSIEKAKSASWRTVRNNKPKKLAASSSKNFRPGNQKNYEGGEREEPNENWIATQKKSQSGWKSRSSFWSENSSRW
ncbi:hypothetical protein HPP92_011030 [Vanilla planifolia]|uniref:Uncharacterized protein n=1 Tax=Vanilla planifolia TaxID=51239 RepID=A0A835UZT7_VANPL|nr:hypothetical protein HPP92_011030 [Vanilla planifolia]